MITMNDLRKKYSEAVEMQLKVKKELRELGETLLEQFTQSLELDELSWVEPVTEKSEPYVNTGLLVNGQFTMLPLSEMTSENVTTLEFCVALTIDQSRQTFPKSKIFFPVKLMLTPAGYSVALNNDEFQRDLPHQYGHQDLSAVIDHLKQMFMNTLEASIPQR